ncbi:nuclear transport factor 2 family protein [Crenobacter caeni]
MDCYRAFSACDWDTMRRMMHPHCVLDFSGEPFGGRTEGRESILDMFRAIQGMMVGSLVFHCHWSILSGDLTAAHWFTTGKPAHGGLYLHRVIAWYQLQDSLIYRFEDFLDTQILAAFWPGGQPCTDFTEAERLVARLESIASPEALARLVALRSAG